MFSCNLPPALLAEWCYCGNVGLEWIQKQESAQKINHGGEKSPAAPAGFWTQDLLITNPSLYHWALPTPPPTISSTGGRLSHWSDYIQHIISSTCTLHRHVRNLPEACENYQFCQYHICKTKRVFVKFLHLTWAWCLSLIHIWRCRRWP